MKKTIIIFCIAFFISNLLPAQERNVDIGVYGGGAYYMGDVNHSKLFYSPSPAYGGQFRYNFDKRYSLRISTVVSQLKGNDLDFDNEFQQTRAHDFTSNITDVSAQVEFNFFPYMPEDKHDKASPFVAAGATLLVSPSSNASGMSFAIPLTVGFKFNIGGRFSAGVEWTYRRSFNDQLDQLQNYYKENPANHDIQDEKQRSYDNSNDWYSFAGVFIMYKLFRDVEQCHAYRFHDVNSKKLKKWRKKRR